MTPKDTGARDAAGPPENTDVTAFFGRDVSRLARLWRTEMDNRLRPLGLSEARWLLLVHLHDIAEGLAQLDLAERAGVSGPTVVRQIDRLEDAGLVARQEDPNDRRVKRVCLTPAGQEKIVEVRTIAARLRREVLADEDVEQVAAALELNRRLIRRFDALTRPHSQGAA